MTSHRIDLDGYYRDGESGHPDGFIVEDEGDEGDLVRVELPDAAGDGVVTIWPREALRLAHALLTVAVEIAEADAEATRAAKGVS